MKKTVLFLLLLTCSLSTLKSQPNKQMVDEVLTTRKIDADTSKKKNWKSGGILALNLNQQNSSFWIGATEDYSLTIGANADLYSNYAKGKTTFDNTLKANYSFIKNKSTGGRKTGDFIDLYSKMGHNLNDSGTIALATVMNLRTQFSNTFDYNYLQSELKRRTSGFFAPAIALLTPGIDFRPTKSFSVFVSPLAAKWIIVSNDPYSYYFPGGVIPPAYGGGVEKPISENFSVDPVRKVDFQLGAFVSAKFNKDFTNFLSYSSRLDLYSNYLDKPQNIDIFWTNNLLIKVNKWLVFTYQWNVAYDDNYHPDDKQGARTQFLGNFGIGVSAKF